MFFVTDLDRSVAFYGIVLGEQPQYREGRSVSYAVGGKSNFTLIQSDPPVSPQSAALLCNSIFEHINEWSQWVSMVDLICNSPSWPMQLVVLRDPDDNTLIVFEAPDNPDASCHHNETSDKASASARRIL
ncbi:hypothetical protein [Tuwongella immobilis]|uniref:hypothetical protein n=1 Tax=Tuwongella immobilis TaxID=692036 RepID=UPI001E2A88FA|nr:hypothetical protein [Tuwongella immobilis]